MKTYQSFSSAETKKIGERLAGEILKLGPRKNVATVLALNGDLGAGKTTFTQGFMRGLGIKKRAASPTFILIRRTKIPADLPRGIRHSRPAKSGIPRGKFQNIYHADFYRLHSAAELKPLGFSEILRNSGNMVLIEWAEKIGKVLPRGTRHVKFFHGRLESERIIKFAN